MKTKSTTLDKSRSYGEIIGQHFVGRVQVSYEQDGVMFDAEGLPVGQNAKAPVKAPPAPVSKPELANVTEAEAESATDATIGVDLQSYAEGHIKAPWVMVVKAVSDTYGVTPANKADAIRIINGESAA